MKYGSIITINTNKELYFVNYLDDNELELIKDNDIETKVIFKKEDNFFLNKDTIFNVIYNSPHSGVCNINGYTLNTYLTITEIVNKELREKKVKVVKQYDDKIDVKHYETTNLIETIDFNYKGISRYIKSITIEKNKEEEIEKGNNNYNSKNGSFENNLEEEEEYFYSIEQKVNEMIESFIENIPEDKRTKDFHKEMNTTITRYIELTKKYYKYENNYYYKPLSNNHIFDVIDDINLFKYINHNSKLQYNDYELTSSLMEKTIRKPLEYVFNVDDDNIMNDDSMREDIKSFEKNSNLNINNYIKENSHVYKKNDLKEFLIYDSDQLENTYLFSTNEEFEINGLLYPNLNDYLDKYNNRPSSMLLERIYKNSYINKYNKNIKYKKDSKCDIFSDKNKLLIKDDGEKYYSFLLKNLPSIIDLLKCFSLTNIPYYNTYSIINNLSLYNLTDLKKDYINTMQDFLKKNINNYKNKFKKKMLQKRKINVNKNELNDLILTPINEKEYYSDNELFYLSNNISHDMLLFEYKKRNVNNKIDKTEKEILEKVKEIKLERGEVLIDTIHKVYNTLSELDSDLKKNVFKDLNAKGEPIINPKESSIMKSSELLYNKVGPLYKLNKQEFIDNLNRIVIEKFEDSKLSDIVWYSKFKNELLLWYQDYKIEEGNIAYVLENDKYYIWSNKNNSYYRWIEYESSNVENLTLNTHDDYFNKLANKKILEIYNREKKIPINNYNEEEKNNLINKILSLKSDKKIKELTYNIQKVFYSREYKKLYSNEIESPFCEMWNEIMNTKDREDKMKYILVFSAKYCTEGDDPNWLYCVKSNIKLVPLFLKRLAIAYKKDTYTEEENLICFEQGELDGSYWIDKYSGYVIKTINFDNEEGYTNDGFKIKMRESVEEVTKNKNDEDIIDDKLNIYHEVLGFLKVIGVKLPNIIKLIKDIEYIASKMLTKMKKDGEKIKQYIIYSVIFTYIQAYNHDEIKESFFNCRTSFEGFPLEEDEEKTLGLKYMVCVLKQLSKESKSIKIIITKETSIIKNMINIINSYVLKYCLELKRVLNEKRKLIILAYENKLKIEEQFKWALFLPRLTKINIESNEIIKSNKYYRYFYIQKMIHNSLKKEKPLIYYSENEKLVNSFFGESKEANIPNNIINSIQKASSGILEKKIKKTLYHFNNDTKDDKSYQHIYTENTILNVINYCIKNSIVIPNISKEITLEELNSLYPDKKQLLDEFLIILTKKLSLLEKEEKVKENLEDPINMDYIDLYNDLLLDHKKSSEKDDEIKKIKSKYLENIKRKDSKYKKKGLFPFLKFKKNKNNLYIDSMIEHYDYLKNLSYNCINELVRVFPNRIIKHVNHSVKNNDDEIIGSMKNMDLDYKHYSDIDTFIIKYNVGSIDTIKDNELTQLYNKYNEIISHLPKLIFNTPEESFIVHYSILIDIYDSIVENPNLKEYLKFLNEYYKKYLNYMNIDAYKIRNINNLSKQKEKEEITESFSKMTDEKREIEYILKEKKLGKWREGLDKSIYKYSKDKYESIKEDQDDDTILEDENEYIMKDEEFENDDDEY